MPFKPCLVKLSICDGVVKEQLLSAEAARVAQCTQLQDHCVEPGLLSLDQGRAGMLPVLSHLAQVLTLLLPPTGRGNKSRLGCGMHAYIQLAACSQSV